MNASKPRTFKMLNADEQKAKNPFSQSFITNTNSLRLFGELRLKQHSDNYKLTFNTFFWSILLCLVLFQQLIKCFHWFFPFFVFNLVRLNLRNHFFCCKCLFPWNEKAPEIRGNKSKEKNKEIKTKYSKRNTLFQLLVQL